MASYQSVYLLPRNIAIDATADYLMSCTVRGTVILNYQIKIYDNSDDSLDYDTGVVDISSSPLYDGETLEHLLPFSTLVNGKEYKWQIITSDGVTSATSSFALFRTNAVPVITFTPPSSITSQSYTFEATYYQAQDVAVNYTQFLFYDSTDTLILTTDKNYTGRIQYTYEGFLNSSSYSVKIVGVTANNVSFETSKYAFTVSYSQPSIDITPSITQLYFDNCTANSLVNVEWSGIVQITGVATGDYGFEDGCITTGSIALNLPTPSDSVEFPVDFPTSVFSHIIEWKPSYEFYTGLIGSFTGDYQCDFGYNGTAFYIIIDGTTYTTNDIDLADIIEGTLFPSETLFPSDTLFPFGGYIINSFIIMVTNNKIEIKSSNGDYAIANISVPVVGNYTASTLYGGDSCFDNVRLLDNELTTTEFNLLTIGAQPSWTPNVLMLATFENSDLDASNISGLTSPITAYELYRKKMGDSTFIKLADLDVSVTSFVDIYTVQGIEYVYNIFAKNDTEISNPVEGTITTDYYGLYLIDITSQETYLFDLNLDLGSMSNQVAYQRFDGYNKYSSYSFGNRNFVTGNVSAVANDIVGNSDFSQSVDFINGLRDFISNGNQKVLKTRKGEIFKVNTFNVNSQVLNNAIIEQPYVVSFGFEQVGDI